MQICPSCFAQESEDARFCGLCGKPLVGVETSSTSLVGMELDDKYVIKELIARGGMGEVYKAEHKSLGQAVAVKLLNRRYKGDTTVVMRFFNEAKSYCRVSHPNAVKLHDFGQLDDGTLYMIMEFVPGDTLTQYLTRVGPLTDKRTLQIGIQLADVLLAAHSEGVVHRDLKPDNIMLQEVSPGRHQLKVLDFGIAKVIDETRGEQLTETGMVFGTPEFMSPEQAQGLDVDHRTDIYAFGMLLYYMRTANLPFHGGAKLSILNRQVHEDPKAPSELAPALDVDPHLEAVILCCLEKERTDRYPDFGEVLEDLERVAAGAAPRLGRAVDASGAPVDAQSLSSPTAEYGATPQRNTEATVRRDPLQAMFDSAPSEDESHKAVTVVRDVDANEADPHSARTRVGPGSIDTERPARSISRPEALIIAEPEIAPVGDDEPTNVTPSSPRVLGAPGIEPSDPRILGEEPESLSPSAPRILGPSDGSGPHRDEPLIIADASTPDAPVSEDEITGEQDIVEIDDEPTVSARPPHSDDVFPVADDEGFTIFDDDDSGDGGFVLGDDGVDHTLVEPGSPPYARRGGSGAIIGLVLVLALSGVAIWYFVIREPAAPPDTDTSETSAPVSSETPGENPPPDVAADVVDDPTPSPVAPSEALSVNVRRLAAARLFESMAQSRLEAGELDDADTLLQHVETHYKDLDAEHDARLDKLGQDVLTAETTFKAGKRSARRLRCDDAEEKAEALAKISPGAAKELEKLAKRCERRLTRPPSQIE